MSRRLSIVLAVSALFLIGAVVALLVWVRLKTPSSFETGLRPIPVSPAPQFTPKIRPSTIIDLPGDPVLVRRATLRAPRPLTVAAPVRLAPHAPRPEVDAFYVSEPLTPASGGFLGKFTANGQEADALNTELAINNGQPAAGEGDDDDGGGDMTPEDAAPAAPLTGGNSQQLDIVSGGDNGRAQLKETILRPKVPQKISELLIESGYEEKSAHDVEAAAKSLDNIQSLRPGAVAFAVGAIDLTGAYRVTQLAIFDNGEYVTTVALAETGFYEEGAEPEIPQGLLDDSNPSPAGAFFTLADGVYSAALRSAAPEAVGREAVRLLQRLADLDVPLTSGETLRLLYARDPRSKTQPASRVIYAGLIGPAATIDCYAFELSDGSYRCFAGKEDAAPSVIPLPPSASDESSAPLPPERNGGVPSRPADSGAVATGGLLPPIRGAPITSLFGMRFHPILHILRLHAGIDFGAPVGSLVRAAADGQVETAGQTRGYGGRVVIKHPGFETTYNHLSEIRVEVGVKVRQGDVIALSGNSGLSTGPHLHFEYLLDGQPVDPLPHLGREGQGHIPIAAEPAPSYASVPVPPTSARPAPPDPAVLAAFAAAKADVDAALAEAER